MCYSGKCKYETYLGDCTISHLFGTDAFPNDAYCALCDKEQEEQERYQSPIIFNDDLPF